MRAGQLLNCRLDYAATLGLKYQAQRKQAPAKHPTQQAPQQQQQQQV
jgi:hypothetical protein